MLLKLYYFSHFEFLGIVLSMILLPKSKCKFLSLNENCPFSCLQKPMDVNGGELRGWTDGEEAFLVCVYNVAPDQPYAVLKAPTSSTAQDIVAQVGSDFPSTIEPIY
ncbi:hypothetical protein AVEN_231210-1 [Araneus ventricosus]|uniref:Uncharacterized protein n=1 Tax=Araneus ventricosus TaxID=182803 RepID=A0A4Y2D7C0_ARAVE|nr:hypothetical protein AVEN_231210-1 [Araneus ventricosus]